MKKVHMKKETIGKISKCFGITPESIRFYEDKGIIAPVRTDGSKYRLYSIDETQNLFRYRQLRALGFTLPDCLSLMHSESSKELCASLSTLESDMADEIERKRLLLKRVKELRGRAHILSSAHKKPQLTHCPAMYWTVTRSGGTIVGDDDNQETIRLWNSRAPFVDSAAVFHFRDGAYSHLDFGICISSEYVSDPSALGDRTNTIGRLPSVFVTADVPSLECVDLHLPESTLSWMTQNGLCPCDDALCVTTMGLGEGESFRYRIMMWIPYRDKAAF